MKKRALFIAIVTLVGCSKIGNASPPSASSGPPPAPMAAPPKVTETAQRLQRSYDSEAAGDLPAALAAIEPIQSSGHPGYVTDLRRGWLLYRLERYAESVASYEKAIAYDRDAIEAKVGLLAPLGAMHRWVDVEREARDILGKDPGSYTATIRLAYALYSQAKFADAATTYRVLMASYPSDVDARAGLGWALLKSGRTDLAHAAFDQTLEISPRNALALEGERAIPPNAK